MSLPNMGSNLKCILITESYYQIIIFRNIKKIKK